MLVSCSFIFDYPIIFKTVKYIDQSNNNCQHMIGLFDTKRFDRFVTDWSVANKKSLT